MEERKHIVILAAGDFPTHELPLKALREADFVVCCDSAYERLRDYETTRLQDPDSSSRRLVDSSSFIVIGDGDSLSDDTKRQLGNRWIHVPEQDYNDLHKAMQWATSHFQLETTSYQILAATGRREDHTLGNISYLATFAEEYPGIDLEMLTDYGRFTIQNSPFKIQNYKSFPRHQVSLFTLDPRTRVTATGLQWPLNDATLAPWWQGTLNSVLSDSFTLSSDGSLLVFQTYDPKPL